MTTVLTVIHISCLPARTGLSLWSIISPISIRKYIQFHIRGQPCLYIFLSRKDDTNKYTSAPTPDTITVISGILFSLSQARIA